MIAAGGGNPIEGVFHHLQDRLVRVGDSGLTVSGHLIMSWIAAAAVVALFVWLGRRMARRKGLAPEGPFDNLFESFILFIRDEVVIANMGHHGHHHAHFLLTTFFFILFANLLGMIPGGQTCTGNLAVTGGLALVTLLYGAYQGVKAQGFLHYVKNLAPAGVPGFVLPILYPVEIVGLAIKHGVLAVRLFANMLAGHLVIGIMLALPALLKIDLLTVPAILLASGISFLELFVAFLQAYVFTMLASLFIGAAVHPEH